MPSFRLSSVDHEEYILGVYPNAMHEVGVGVEDGFILVNHGRHLSVALRCGKLSGDQHQIKIAGMLLLIKHRLSIVQKIKNKIGAICFISQVRYLDGPPW